MREGDAFYGKREQDGMADKAIASYRKAIALDEGKADAYRKIAKAHYWLGSRQADDSKRAEVRKQGIEYAKMGVAADENNVAAHFWLGVMYAAMGRQWACSRACTWSSRSSKGWPRCSRPTRASTKAARTVCSAASTASCRASRAATRSWANSKEPDEVAQAFLHALTDANPKRRHMVVPNQREAELTIKAAIARVVQLNEKQTYTYDREGLIKLLDEAWGGK